MTAAANIYMLKYKLDQAPLNFLRNIFNKFGKNIRKIDLLEAIILS